MCAFSDEPVPHSLSVCLCLSLSLSCRSLTQHWTYTLDLVENYVSIFPDKEQWLLFDSAPVPFFVSPAFVKPREDRYTQVDGSVRVYKAVSQWGEPDFPVERQNAMLDIFKDPNFIGDPRGAGGVWQRAADKSVFRVAPIVKLLVLGVLKFSTMDPMGMGVEMEGGKPGWDDAMNGLPGLVGSGMPETYEMLRILRFVQSGVQRFNRPLSVPEELATLMNSLLSALQAWDTSVKDDRAEYVYWDASNRARELYRGQTLATFSGVTVPLAARQVLDMLSAMQRKVDFGIARALSGNNGLSPTYFYYECTDVRSPAPGKVMCNSFRVQNIPLFLEGPVRHLKVLSDPAQRKDLYDRTKASALYDAKLKMYTICSSLRNMRQELGRVKAFAPGWLENQSVWLHMSYKYYLELLRGGLYAQFFDEIKTGLVPFMDSTVYGRSPLEAASFLVSSAFPDPKLHGSSFLARLSGSTAEFLSMWFLMMAGPTPFSLDATGALQLTLSPVLPGWLFNVDGTAAFTFLGSVAVTYHNPSRADSWTLGPKSCTVSYVDGHTVETGGVISGDVPQDVRSFKVTAIDVRLR